MITKKQLLCIVFVALMVSGMVASAQERDLEAAKLAASGHSPDMLKPPRPSRLPDLTKGDKLPEPGKSGPILWNMGPTGIIGIKNGGFAGDQVAVVGVLKGSPAEGKVLPGDVVLGVQGSDFVTGGHLGHTVGNAIIKAEEEAGKGIFKVHLWRDLSLEKRAASRIKSLKGVDVEALIKETESDDTFYEWKSAKDKTAAVDGYNQFPVDGIYTNVTLQLKVMGTYSDTSPWECPVAEKILEDAWKVLARKGRGGLGSGYSGGWEPAVALVASGKPEYIAAAKQWVHEQKMCHDMNATVPPKTTIYSSWHAGFRALSLAIYYDATGDDYVLPELRFQAIQTAMGQSGGGFWGHTFTHPQEGGKLHLQLPGYGAMNNAGGRCFFLLTLARKAGINDPEINQAIARASLGFGTVVDKGVLGYGGSAPVGSDDSNGKNYGATYAFYVLGKKHAAKHFAMHSAHAAFSRRGGHGSPIMWYYTPLSANVAGPRGVQASMRNMRWFYTLARRHDGSFILQGEQAGITGGQFNPTARHALFYSAPLQQTIITGKDADKECWFTDEELEELLLSARGMETADGKRIRGQITDPVLLAQIGKPWNLRGSDELIDMLDHFYPQMRGRVGVELAKRYQTGEKDIIAKVLPLLKSDEARMRGGACRALSACGPDIVLENLSKIAALLKDDAEFVRMTAVSTIGKATKPGDRKRELLVLQAAAENYVHMSQDGGNVRSASKGVLLADGSKLTIDPFSAGYDEETVREALEKIVTLDPGGTVPGSWSRETAVKLAGPITFSAEEVQLCDAMFGARRKTEAQALLQKYGYREASEGDVINLRKRQRLNRTIRYKAYFKKPNITLQSVMQAPDLYRDHLDILHLWMQDDPARLVPKRLSGGAKVQLTLKQLVEIVEKNAGSTPPPSIYPDVVKLFKGKLAALDGDADRFKLCHAELKDLQRKNFFRKMSAMSYLVTRQGVDALDDITPFIGHEQWRLRQHAQKLAVDLAKRGASVQLIEQLKSAEGEPAVGLLAVLVAAQVKPALVAVKASLKNDDPKVRAAAVQAVFALGGDAELKTVFAFMQQAKGADDFDGCEMALLSRRDDPAHVKRVSGGCITLLARSQPPLRRSLAWVLAQFGGAPNLAAIEKAAMTTKDLDDLRNMVTALAYSPDPAASKTMLELMKVNDRLRDEVAAVSVHRMVGANGMGNLSDKERVAFARKILNMKFDTRLITFLGSVHTGSSLDLLFEIMKNSKDNRAMAAKSVMNCLEGFYKPSRSDAKLALHVVTQLIEYIEVTHLRGGATKQVKNWREAAGYADWKALQSRAAEVLLKLHNPKEAELPQFDDLDLDM